MPRKRALPKAKSEDVFGQARRPAKMFRAGLYARVSTNDQQTLAMQNRAMREYAARRGWTIALQVREVNSGAAQREAREKVAGSRPPPGDRSGAGVAAGPLGPVGNGSAGDPSGTGTSGRRVRLPDGGAGPDHASRHEPWPDCWRSSPSSNERSCGSEPGRAWLMRGRTGNGWAGRQLRPSTPRKSGSCTAPASANPRSPAGCRSAAPQFAGFWADLFP